jgi:putative nucleotidyltransferase with HDIG domain
MNTKTSVSTQGTDPTPGSPEEMWRRYEFIANTAKDFLTLINADYVYEAANRAYCSAHSKHPDEIVGRKVADVWGEERFALHVKPPLDKCFRGDEVQYQSWFQFSTLGMRYMDVTYYPYYSSEGSLVTHAVVVSRDMTAYKKAEDQTKRQLRRLTALHDVAITSQLDVNLIAKVLLSQITNELEMDAARVLLYDTETESLNQIATAGFRNPQGLSQRVPLPPEHQDAASAPPCVISLPDTGGHAFSTTPPDFWKAEGFAACFSVPLVAGGNLRGVLQIFHRQPVALDPELTSFLETLGGQVGVALDNANLFESVRQANVDLVAAYDTTLEGWVRTLDLRDKETEGHTQRVTAVTLKLAAALGITDRDELEHIRRGALLHDIGKMAIPDSILLKPGPLTDDEWHTMRRHPEYAYALLSPIAFLQPALVIPYCHHERWDGSGYPQGLAGTDIPIEARMFAVVDAWDALSSNRPYRAAWPADEVAAYLREHAGILFDPEIVQTFLRLEIDASEYAAGMTSAFPKVLKQRP